MSRYVQPSHFCCRPATILHGAKMAGAREPFEFFLRSASSEHYIELNESSSPTLPIVIDVRCEIGKTSDYTVVARIIRGSVRQVSKEGLKHSNRAQIALARQLGSVCDCSRSCILAATASAHPMLILHPVVARHCVCYCSWLQSLAVHCRHVQCSASYEARPTMLCIRLV